MKNFDRSSTCPTFERLCPQNFKGAAISGDRGFCQTFAWTLRAREIASFFNGEKMSAEKENEMAEVSCISPVKKQKTKKAGTEVEYKWTDKQVEALICEWAGEPCLYNVGHADYMKNDKRLNAGKRIVATLNENTNPEDTQITGKILMTQEKYF